MAAIHVNGLEKSYGDVEAVAGLSFAVERGELFGFLGPNGAGKTTTIRALTGQIGPDAGRLEVLGTDPAAEPIETRRRVGILPEEGTPPSFLTPREYFEFVGEVRDLDADAIAERTATWADRLGLEGKLETLHTDLSRGQQQKVMIIQAFLHEPEVVFIDEPLANLDPLVQERVKRFLRGYAADGNAVFVSTHNIDVAEEICSRVGIVANGSLVAERSLDETDESLLSVFLDHVEGEEVSYGYDESAVGRADPAGDRDGGSGDADGEREVRGAGLDERDGEPDERDGPTTERANR